MFKVSNIEIVHQATDTDVLSGLISDRIRALSVYNGRTSPERIVQVSISVPEVDPLLWLSEIGPDTGIYWSSRDAKFAAGGAGYALKLSGKSDFFRSLDRERMTKLLDDSDGEVRFYGGVRFSADGDHGPEWSSFENYSFVVPRFELQRTGSNSRFIVNLLLPQDFDSIPDIVASIPRMLSHCEPNKESGTSNVRVLSRVDHPDRNGWTKNIAWALSAFSRSRLGKVVLARRAVYSLDQTIDGARALSMLKKETPGCFHFLFSPNKRTSFVGASPERLLSIQDRRVVSEAVAGTRPRGTDESNDARLREELLHSEKDQREHQFVRMTIKDTLSNYCDVLHVDNQAKEMILSRGRHLVSHIEGVLRREETDTLSVVRDLHPTAAVGGYPTRDALDVIEGLEPFDRGWYAGPVGWIGSNDAEFAVTIRSGLIVENELSLYTGAGIVGGSNPESEWNEIEQKLQDFVQVFGLEESVT